GKTILASESIRSATSKGKRVVVIAHRKELIDQTVGKLDRFNVRAGAIMADDPRTDAQLPVQVCTIQTLARRVDWLPPADLVIVDDVHHAASNSYRAVLDLSPNAIVIGLTATPWRTDRFGLGDYFEGHVVAASYSELMESGALVRYDAYAFDAPDIHDVGTV